MSKTMSSKAGQKTRPNALGRKPAAKQKGRGRHLETSYQDHLEFASLWDAQTRNPRGGVRAGRSSHEGNERGDRYFPREIPWKGRSTSNGSGHESLHRSRAFDGRRAPSGDDYRRYDDNPRRLQDRVRPSETRNDSLGSGGQRGDGLDHSKEYTRREFQQDAARFRDAYEEPSGRTYRGRYPQSAREGWPDDADRSEIRPYRNSEYSDWEQAFRRGYHHRDHLEDSRPYGQSQSL
ncbi:MAG TPA: hypothetical protein PLN52_06660, partial [Opitutaceae bacterium]|nr:hypothetical protein [Opitutaceae bacterium]